MHASSGLMRDKSDIMPAQEAVECPPKPCCSLARDVDDWRLSIASMVRGCCQCSSASLSSWQHCVFRVPVTCLQQFPQHAVHELPEQPTLALPQFTATPLLHDEKRFSRRGSGMAVDAARPIIATIARLEESFISAGVREWESGVTVCIDDSVVVEVLHGMLRYEWGVK